jgi:hypothetical protein
VPGDSFTIKVFICCQIEQMCRHDLIGWKNDLKVGRFEMIKDRGPAQPRPTKGILIAITVRN